MIIVADENMPYAHEVFGHLGEVRLHPGRELRRVDLREADLLMVRSVTRVGHELLEGTPVRFVGTATIGTDHVDQPWLAEAGIGFSSAPGCNAESVAQYMAAAMTWTAGRLGRPLGGCSIGIVGVGNCGSRVERVARALGMTVVLNDPPLARQTGEAKYRPLEELMGCDVLALHVPLTREGEDATAGLIDAAVLDRMKPGAVLINACRGGVVDEAALAERLDSGRLGGAVLDAWKGEPRIDPAMLRRALLGTPHIAGYSFDGKVTGTRMIYEAACRHLGIEPVLAELEWPEAAVPFIRLDAAGRDFDSVAAELVQAAYPIARDDADLRRSASEEPEAMGRGFDTRRKLYPLRREFRATRVQVTGAPPDWLDAIGRLGFKIGGG